MDGRTDGRDGRLGWLEGGTDARMDGRTDDILATPPMRWEKKAWEKKEWKFWQRLNDTNMNWSFRPWGPTVRPSYRKDGKCRNEMDSCTDGWMDSWTDGWMDGQTVGRTDNNLGTPPTGERKKHERKKHGNYKHDHYHHQHYNHQHHPQLREWKYQVEFPCKNLKYTKGKK